MSSLITLQLRSKLLFCFQLELSLVSCCFITDYYLKCFCFLITRCRLFSFPFCWWPFNILIWNRDSLKYIHRQNKHSFIYVFFLKEQCHEDFYNHLGRAVQKLVNADPGLNVKWAIVFSCLKMFFTSVWCSFRLQQLKTAGQTIYMNRTPHQ